MIEKYLDAFCYSHSYISKNSTYLFYLKKEYKRKTLYLLDLEKNHDRSKAIRISNIDFSKQTFWPESFDEKNQNFYFMSDTQNKEDMNLFSLNLKTRKVTQITKTTYCNIHGFNHDFSILVFADRYESKNGQYYSRLYIRDMKNQKERLLFEDQEQEFRLSWSGVIFDRENKYCFISMDFKNMRKRRNIAKVNLISGDYELLIPEKFQSPSTFTVGQEVIENDLYFVSDVDGFLNFYYMNISSREITKLTNFLENYDGYFRHSHNQFTISIPNEKEDKTEIINIKLNKEDKPKLASYSFKGPISILEGDELWYSESSISQPPTFKKPKLKKLGHVENTINNFLGKRDKLVHNSYRYIEYKSFDNKKVSGFLSIPKGRIRGAVITSFYGGENRYSFMTQLFAELGIIELSPSVRGSWHKGLEWRNLIKGDLGGNEILDLHWAAHYLQKEFDLLPCQIGVEGGSHGGYSVLRALTMPVDFNGRTDASFPYGFGICWAGFADLEDFYKTSNIPDWLVDMLGPYEGNEQKYRERSPVNYFENLSAPLFISHGTNDVRVSPSSMDGFLEKLKNSDKDYVLHMMEGLGHGAGNRKEEISLYNKMIKFLNEVLG